MVAWIEMVMTINTYISVGCRYLHGGVDWNRQKAVEYGMEAVAIFTIVRIEVFLTNYRKQKHEALSVSLDQFIVGDKNPKLNLFSYKSRQKGRTFFHIYSAVCPVIDTWRCIVFRIWDGWALTWYGGMRNRFGEDFGRNLVI